jgi:hypothetical protein
MSRENHEMVRDQGETPDHLRRKAAHARRLAREFTDDETVHRLTEFAQELEARAAALEPKRSER